MKYTEKIEVELKRAMARAHVSTCTNQFRLKKKACPDCLFLPHNAYAEQNVVYEGKHILSCFFALFVFIPPYFPSRSSVSSHS